MEHVRINRHSALELECAEKAFLDASLELVAMIRLKHPSHLRPEEKAALSADAVYQAHLAARQRFITGEVEHAHE